MQDKLSALIFNTRNLLRRLEAINDKLKHYPRYNKKISHKVETLKFKIIRCRKPLATFYHIVEKIELIIKEIEDVLKNKSKNI